MNETTQRRIISTAAIVVMATAWIAAIQKGRLIPTSRVLIGYGFAFFITSLMADLGSSFGASLALIIMVATVLENGDVIVAWIGDRSAGKHGVSKVKTGVAATASYIPQPPDDSLQPIATH
jgi:hypothetical protein